MEEKVKEIVEMKQRSLAEENQKSLEALNERYSICLGRTLLFMICLLFSGAMHSGVLGCQDIVA
jgi:hypothetical protein